MISIDQSNNKEKINTFKALVENYNDEVAKKYLEKFNWDETVNLFLIFIKFKKNISDLDSSSKLL